jgi:hypothetical protein
MFSSIIVAITSIIIVNYLYGFYSKLKHYPNGPIPLPFFGNLFSNFRFLKFLSLVYSVIIQISSKVLFGKLNRNPRYFFDELAKKYDGIYTFWFGSKPVIFITSLDLVKKAFHQIECSDRWEQHLETALCDSILGGHKTFIFMNWSEECKHLRNMSIKSLRSIKKITSYNNYLLN